MQHLINFPTGAIKHIVSYPVLGLNTLNVSTRAVQPLNYFNSEGNRLLLEALLALFCVLRARCFGKMPLCLPIRGGCRCEGFTAAFVATEKPNSLPSRLISDAVKSPQAIPSALFLPFPFSNPRLLLSSVHLHRLN